jgi:hypothetical protein
MPADHKKSPDHRDRATIAACVFVVLLVAACLWVFSELKDRNDELNCVTSGRTNCAPLVQ